MFQFEEKNVDQEDMDEDLLTDVDDELWPELKRC